MKKIIFTIFLTSVIWSCSVLKDKKDIETIEQIETKEIRKGDTVTYIVPNIKYKDTVIRTESRQGTILKTYYDKSGQISNIDCISSEIELLRSELRTMTDNSKEKKESYFQNPLLWLIIAIGIVVLLKK